MDFWLKTLSPKLILGLLPMLLIKAGNFFKNKDANATGPDDAFGNILLAAAPAMQAADDGDDKALRKALKIVRDTIDGYLKGGV